VRWVWVLAATQLWAQSYSSIEERWRNALEKQRTSVTRQREAARKQAENLRTWLPIGAEPKAPDTGIEPPACEPMSELVLAPMVDRVSQEQKLEPSLIHAVIQQESGFRPCAVSASGAQGLMQIMPATAGELGLDDPFDPPANIAAGARYLRQLLDRYHGDLFRALGAYNAGPAAVDEASGIPEIPETLDYVTSIFQKLERK
jgi:soluble lytic murein transglycosylase-like protein